MTAVVLGSLLAGCAPAGWRQQLQSEDPLRRIDGAIAAGRARDPAAAPLLVDRLEDDDVAVRMYAILALERIEGTSMGYRYWAGEADRAHMAQQWRTYLKDHRRTPLQAIVQRLSPHGAAGGNGAAPSTQPQGPGGAP